MALDWKALYAGRRNQARCDLADRRRRVFDSSPELSAWHGRFTQAQGALGFAAARGDEGEEWRCRQLLDALEEEKRELLRAAGYRADELELRYDCPKCRDYGRVNGKDCDCLLALKRAWELDQWDGKQCFAAYRTDIFPEENGQRAQMTRLLAICLAYAEAFPANDPPGLFVRGGVGLGKTFALNCIGRQVLERGFRVRRITDYQFHQLLMERVFKGDRSLYEALMDADLLVYDDLGAAPKTQRDIAENHFFALLDERCQRGRPMLVGTNYSMAEIDAAYGERCSSRLLDKQCFRGVLLKGQDLRLRRD